MKKYLMRTAVLLAGFILASCSQDFMTQTAEKVEEFNTNFQNLVMGDLKIHPDQTWTTSESTTINVSVDLNYGESYNVFIYQTAPLLNTNAAFIGMTSIQSGETKTITIAKPAGQELFYAACYDKDSHATVKDFTIVDNKGSVSFGNNRSKARTRSVTVGHRWSITPQSMPDLSAYYTDMLEMKEEFNGNGPEGLQPDPSEIHLKITDSYSGEIARIQSYANQSVYVTGTWTVPEDQRVTGNSVVIVGNGGKIIIPDDCILSTNANNEEGTTGMIYVLPGGKIEGAGLLQFSNGTQTYSYNAGNINVANLEINGGTLYNAGTIGDVTPPALSGSAGTTDVPSKFINMGTATFASTGGAGLSIENACNMTVIGTMQVGKSSKLESNSYLECGSLNMAGSNLCDLIFYMGENAYLKVNNEVKSINNFGLWGPDTDNNTYAFLDIPYNVSYINWTNDQPGAFCLDKVYAILREGYQVADPTSDYKYNPRGDAASALLLTWMNGRKENANDQEGISDNCLAGHTRTCVWGTSALYSVTKSEEDNCGINIEKGSDPDPIRPVPSEQTITDNTPEDNPSDDTTPEDNPDDDTTPPSESTTIIEVPANANWVYYAFEDLGGTRDFDFNDEVIRVSTPVNGRSVVQILAVGAELNAYILYQGSRLGAEVHAAIGAKDHVITNTKMPSVVPNMFRVLGEISVPAGTSIGNLDFGLEVLNNDGSTRSVIASRVNGNNSTSKSAYGSAPLYLVINGDEDGKWYWPREMVNITNAFSNFSTWGSTLSEGTDWYMPKNANTYNVVTW